MGYLLPWGQMSYWGAQVIINLFAAIPFVGPDLALLIRGDYVVGDATLNRFFAFHVIAVPLVLLGLVMAHIIALHEVGSNNPDGVEIKATKDAKTGIPLDGIPFHPYYSVHDLMGVAVFLMLFSAVIFFMPEMGGYFLEHNNFIPADSLKTPPHIAPVWYFTPFYSMLRAVTDDLVNVFVGIVAVAGVVAFFKLGLKGIWKFAPLVVALVLAVLLKFFDAKFWGVVAMGGGVLILFALPWLDYSPVKSIRYRPGWNKVLYGLFVVNFFMLGYLGTKLPSPLLTLLAQGGTLFYFAFFVLMPWWSRIGGIQSRCPTGWCSMPTDTAAVRTVASILRRLHAMKKLLLSCILSLPLLLLGTARAAEGGIHWDTFPTERVTNLAALQHGSKLFVNYCLNCHNAAFMRYNRLRDIGLTEQQIKENLVLTGVKVGEQMKVAMDPKDAKAWFGGVPPDLTLDGPFARRRRQRQWSRLPLHLLANLLPR